MKALVTNPAEDTKGIYYISVTAPQFADAEVATIYRTEQAMWRAKFEDGEVHEFHSLEAAEAWVWAMHLELRARLEMLVSELTSK